MAILARVVRPQPSPYYLATQSPDKPKFAAADMAMYTPVDPPKASSVRHFVRRCGRPEGVNA